MVTIMSLFVFDFELFSFMSHSTSKVETIISLAFERVFIFCQQIRLMW